MNKTGDFNFDARQSVAFCGTLRTDRTFYEPLEEVELTIERADCRRCDVFVYDPQYDLYAGRPLTLRSGKGTIRFRAQGLAGTHNARVIYDDGMQRHCFFVLRAVTRINTGKAAFDELQGYLEANTAKCSARVIVDDRPRTLACRAGDTSRTLWFRDGTYGLLGYVYWHRDIREFCDWFLATQSRSGFFNGSRCHDPDLNRNEFGRCTNEPDLEYIAVIAVHRVWQATGDDAWMRRQLGALERGMRTAMTTRTKLQVTRTARGRERVMHHVLSWDAEHGLIKRTHTCDTWDFQIDAPDGSAVYVIANCDQSGFFLACRLLARLNRHIGKDEAADTWEQRASEFRRRSKKLLWDGSKYRHHHHLDELDHGDFAESTQLSMGNTWAITRGLADHRQATSILGEYQRRWRETGHKWPWWSLQPGYPDAFLADSWGGNQGAYANGGLIPWVGGELTLGAFSHGFEKFAVQQLRLYHELLTQTHGGSHTWYWPDGTPGLSTPESTTHSIWDIGAWMRALQEGLAGIVDASKQFDAVLCSPRWPAAKVRRARVVSAYPNTDAYFGYDYRSAAGEIRIDFGGTGSVATFSVLLPAGKSVSSVTVDGGRTRFKTTRVEQSCYCEFRTDIRHSIAPESFGYLKERRADGSVPADAFDLNCVCIKLQAATNRKGSSQSAAG